MKEVSDKCCVDCVTHLELHQGVGTGAGECRLYLPPVHGNILHPLARLEIYHVTSQTSICFDAP